MCGRQSLCEHVLTDKLAANIACNSDRLHHPSNRVLPSAGARMCLMANRLPAAYAKITGCAAPPIGCRKAPSGSISWDGAKRKPVRQARGECAFTYWQGQLIASRAGGAENFYIPGIRARNVEGHGQTWGQAHPLLGVKKCKKEVSPGACKAVPACADGQTDCQRRVRK